MNEMSTCLDKCNDFLEKNIKNLEKLVKVYLEKVDIGVLNKNGKGNDIFTKEFKIKNEILGINKGKLITYENFKAYIEDNLDPKFEYSDEEINEMIVEMCDKKIEKYLFLLKVNYKDKDSLTYVGYERFGYHKGIILGYKRIKKEITI